MVYSNTKYHMDTPPELLPKPPMFMTLITDAYNNPDGKGKVRHHDDLAKVRRYLSWVYQAKYRYSWDAVAGRGVQEKVSPGGVAWVPWKLFEWKGDHYELLFEAKLGDSQQDCPLMAKGKRVSKRNKPAEDHEVQRAIASIMGEGQ